MIVFNHNMIQLIEDFIKKLSIYDEISIELLYSNHILYL